MERIVIVTGFWDDKGNWKDTTSNTNKLLSEGWRVKNVSPMGAYGIGYGYGYACAGGETSWGTSDSKSYSDKGFAALLVIEKDE